MTDIEIIMDVLRSQFSKVLASDDEYYSQCNIVLSNEQQFVKSDQRDKNTIYIVVKVLPAQITFGQRIVPFTINAVSENNKIEMCQRLLNEFANTYNLKSSNLDEHIITQTYTTPAISSNFNEVYSGYRSLFYMSGTFLITETANTFDIYYKGNKIDAITSGFSVDIQNDTQATFSSKDFTKSRPMIATFTITFTCYFVTDGITLDLLKLTADKNINNSFDLRLAFRNGTAISSTFHLVNMSTQNNAGEIPVVSITMTE